MDKLILLSTCEDGACCCFPPRTTVALISILSMVVCVVDMMTFDSHVDIICCNMKQYVDCARHVLTMLFQIANVLLIISTVMENSMIATIYIWYALSYVVLGLCLSIMEMLCRIGHEGETCIAVFGCEVLFYFVISRCLPIVNSYKQQLDECASRNTFQ